MCLLLVGRRHSLRGLKGPPYITWREGRALRKPQASLVRARQISGGCSKESNYCHEALLLGFANTQPIGVSLCDLYRLLFQAVKLIAGRGDRNRLRIVLTRRLSPGAAQHSRFFQGACSRPGDRDAVT